MSAFPTRGSPAHQNPNTFCENYDNQGLHVNTSEGTINSYQTIINPRPSDPLRELHQRCSPSAAFNSGARFDPPRCTESTRLGITRRIEEWIASDPPNGMQASILWLYGGAGVGKSAFAQSLSESFQVKQELAASFFFVRSDGSRNNGEQVIPTLVSQLVHTFKGLDRFVKERIRTTPDLFTKQHQVQMQELFVEPLCGLKSRSFLRRVVESLLSIVTMDVQGSWPRLIVIDGLDECQNPDVQCELLRVIARAIPRIPYPLRFLITSRPESHITRTFDYDRDLQATIIHRYNLSDDRDADADIQKYLEKEFKEIRRVHHLRNHLPLDWPGQTAISQLVVRSSNHFIYASTVIKYIRSPKHRPDDRLKVILGLQPPQDQDRPYPQLDTLYSFVFQGVGNFGQLEKICLLLGILYFQSRNIGFFAAQTYSYRSIVEGVLGLRAGDLFLLIDPIISLITINNLGIVQIFHKSLFDYLLDPSRGGHLPFDLARVHEVAATHILKKYIHASGFPQIEHINLFVYHCRFGFLNNTLKAYLYSLPVNHLSWNIKSSLQLMFDFFDILRREDFDSTGQYYKQYVAKWASCINSAIKGYPQLHSIDKVKYVKVQLDPLLKEWKPSSFNLMNIGDVSRRVASIEDEHHILTTFAKASTPPDESNTIVSSLVIGEHFIHSYHIRLLEWNIDTAIFLILIIYSRHNNTSFLKTSTSVDIIGAMHGYLLEAEKFFSLDFYQKYGIEPEDK